MRSITTTKSCGGENCGSKCRIAAAAGFGVVWFGLHNYRYLRLPSQHRYVDSSLNHFRFVSFTVLSPNVLVNAVEGLTNCDVGKNYGYFTSFRTEVHHCIYEILFSIYFITTDIPHLRNLYKSTNSHRCAQKYALGGGFSESRSQGGGARIALHWSRNTRLASRTRETEIKLRRLYSKCINTPHGCLHYKVY